MFLVVAVELKRELRKGIGMDCFRGEGRRRGCNALCAVGKLRVVMLVKMESDFVIEMREGKRICYIEEDSWQMECV